MTIQRTLEDIATEHTIFGASYKNLSLANKDVSLMAVTNRTKANIKVEPFYMF